MLANCVRFCIKLGKFRDSPSYRTQANIGFSVAANAWNGTDVIGCDGADGDLKICYSKDFLNSENDWGAAQGAASDLTRHMAMQFASTEKGGLLDGFESLGLLGLGSGRSAMLEG